MLEVITIGNVPQTYEREWQEWRITTLLLALFLFGLVEVARD